MRVPLDLSARVTNSSVARRETAYTEAGAQGFEIAGTCTTTKRDDAMSDTLCLQKPPTEQQESYIEGMYMA